MIVNLDPGRYLNWTPRPFDVVWPVPKGQNWLDLTTPLDKVNVGSSCYLRCGDFGDIDFGEANVIRDIQGNRVYFEYPWMRTYDIATRPFNDSLLASTTIVSNTRTRISLTKGSALLNTESQQYVTIGGTTAALTTHRLHPIEVRSTEPEITYPAGTPVNKSIGLFITTMPQNIVIEGGVYPYLITSRTIKTRVRGVTVIHDNRYPWPPLVTDCGRDIEFEDCKFVHVPDAADQYRVIGHGISRTATDVRYRGCSSYNVMLGAGEAAQGFVLEDSQIIMRGAARFNSAVNIGLTTGNCRVSNNRWDLDGVGRYSNADIATDYRGTGNSLE